MQMIATQTSQIRTVRINDFLWRVTAPDGFVFGHVERTITPDGERFDAKRYRLAAARFMPVGRFWQFDDAVQCLQA